MIYGYGSFLGKQMNILSWFSFVLYSSVWHLKQVISAYKLAILRLFYGSTFTKFITFDALCILFAIKIIKWKIHNDRKYGGIGLHLLSTFQKHNQSFFFNLLPRLSVWMNLNYTIIRPTGLNTSHRICWFVP